MNHVGKKGDTIHIPKPTRGTASAKAAETQVTLIANTETELTLSIDKHYEYSRLIEDIVAVQAIPSYRKFYTDDAGYALARQVDWDLFLQARTLQGGTATSITSYATPGTTLAGTVFDAAVIGSDGSTAWNPSASTNTGNGAALADAGLRQMMQTLDDDDVPMTGRELVIPPVEKNTMLGIDRFVLWNNVGEAGSSNSIRNGFVGDVYGMKVYISTACPTMQATDASTNYRVGMMVHKDAMALVEQMTVRSQTQYKQEYLSDLFTADTIYGVGELRDNAGIAFVVPA